MAGKSPKEPTIKLGKPETITTQMDPHLQQAVLKLRSGQPLDPTVSQRSEAGELTVDVIAKLKDVQTPVPGLDVVRTIGQIVTGTVRIEDVERVHDHVNVVSLKLATKVYPELAFSVAEINATQAQLQAALPPDFGAMDGAGMIVGIVDFGGDFAHRNFRTADGATRLLYLWDQAGGSTRLSPDGFGYGREFDAAAINSALQSNNPYLALRYNPGDSSHGTHVMDIAAGNGRATGNPGVAPAADLIFVQLSVDGDEIGGDGNFGNSRHLLEAVDYIFTKAAALGRPAVVNLSLGTHGGPHDGSTLAEQGFDELLRQPGRAIVIAAGNSHQARGHASGAVRENTPRTLTWQIGAGDVTENELEVWYAGGRALAVTLITPAGQRLGPVELDTTVTLEGPSGPVGQIIHRQHDPNNGDNQIDILLDASLPAGDWGVELTTSEGEPVAFHAWVERDAPQFQSRFAAADDDRTHTLGSISCGAKTIVVGSYLAGVPDAAISGFSAEGPTRDGKQKPEVSAPGQFLPQQGILAARSTTQGTTRMSGTSMAAPHVTGLVALLFQAADCPLGVDELRTVLTTAARKNPPAGTSWSPRYGHGRVDAVATLQTQVPLPITVPSAPVTVLEPTYANGNGAVSVEHLVTVMASAAIQARARVRFQLEVEPLTVNE